MTTADYLSVIIEVKGHILDSLVFSDMLDEILTLGGDYEILRLDVGHDATNPSYAQLLVKAGTDEALGKILTRLKELGANQVEE